MRARACGWLAVVGLLASGCVSKGEPVPFDEALIGKTPAEAQARLAEMGMTDVEWLDADFEPTVPSSDPGDVVLWQSPVPQAEIHTDDTVKLLITEGPITPVPVIVPAWADDGTVYEALRHAADLGLNLAFYDGEENPADPEGPSQPVIGNHSSNPAGSTAYVGQTVGVILFFNRNPN